MQVVTNLRQLDRAQFGPIALVPTMGALHEGHAELIHRAREKTAGVLVSVFVNPLQFDSSADLQKYPRTPESDEAKAQVAGAMALWTPTSDEIYPGQITMEDAGSVGERYEGASRPGHFEGMLTVVKRLFDLAQPRWAVFGEKDFQQLFLVKELVRCHNLDIEILAVPTVREPSGLAISSRNVRLSDEDKRSALVISRALTEASGMTSLNLMQRALDQRLASESAFKVDYAVIIDEDDFSLATEGTLRKRALVAGWVNGVRLIDNMRMGQK